MEKEIRQSITDYKMPRYICEILCSHYAKSFLEMTIICENDTYIFSYDKKIREGCCIVILRRWINFS